MAADVAEGKCPIGNWQKTTRFNDCEVAVQCRVPAFLVTCVAGLFLIVAPARATIRYVGSGNSAPIAPYTSWTTAARDIQSAIDVSVNGDVVLVTNGVYQGGARVIHGRMSNRVALTNGVTVRSVNGPGVTTIRGKGRMGDGAVRCAYVGVNCTLAGFTLARGATRTSGSHGTERSGGGAWCEAGAVVSNCTFTGNEAKYHGGGAYGGKLVGCTFTGNSAGYYGGGASLATLHNCTLTGNYADSFGGGGAYECTLHNCTLTGNTSDNYGGGVGGGCTLYNCTLTDNSAETFGGGASASTLHNCIVYYNAAVVGPNHHNCTMDYCCTVPVPAGKGNIPDDPRLVSTARIGIDSPCVGSGLSAYALGTDMDAEPWRAVPAIGADEPYGTSTGRLTVAIHAPYAEVALGFTMPLTAVIDGAVASNTWDFGDGDCWTNQTRTSHGWTVPGTYDVVCTAWNADHPEGVAATVGVSVVTSVHYADISNSVPVYPYSSWATAATNIQDAVSAGTAAGRVVWVADGIYSSGGRAMHGGLTNRVALTNAVTVRSANGPDATVIKGEGPVGTGAVRCAYVGTNCLLAGFTLTNGATRSAGNYARERSGGGVWCEPGGIVSNCTVTGNAAHYGGGGASYGTLYDCTLAANSATRGGGTYRSTLERSTLAGNSADYGGGCRDSELHGCAVTGNSASYGGGTYNGTLYACTITGNSAGFYGGGSLIGTLCNCIVYHNAAPVGANYHGGTFDHCCTTPVPGGSGNITDDPRLVSAARIRRDSPCVREGNAAYVPVTDLDGQAWFTPPAIGADQPHLFGTGALLVSIGAPYTNVAAGYAVPLTARVRGQVTEIDWDFGDGTSETNQAYATHSWGATGTYAVVLTAHNADCPAGISATTVVSVVEGVHYVNVSNTTPAHPYASWATAATNIQDAVSAGPAAGRVVRVTNGLYDAGGVAFHGVMTSRVALTNAVTVRSVNGPDQTVIRGRGPVGDGAVRCAFVGADCMLDGFTLTNGATVASGDSLKDQSGGGAWCEGGGLLSNCTIAGNSADEYGGGSYAGTLRNCRLAGNYAGYGGGGVYNGVQYGCTLSANSAGMQGGGTLEGTLYDCTFTSNFIAFYGSGGGAYGGTLHNCAFAGNRANQGGGTAASSLHNCTLRKNSADLGGGATSGDLYGFRRPALRGCRSSVLKCGRGFRTAAERKNPGATDDEQVGLRGRIQPDERGVRQLRVGVHRDV